MCTMPSNGCKSPHITHDSAGFKLDKQISIEGEKKLVNFRSALVASNERPGQNLHISIFANIFGPIQPFN